AFVLWTRPFVRLFEAAMEWIPFLPAGLKKKIAGMLESGAEGLASLKDVRLLAGILATSQAQWLLNGLTVHLALWSFGIHVDPLVSCIVLGVTAFGVTVPSSPGYFGVIQLCFMAVLKFFTKDETAVFAASIYYHMIQYIPVTLIGLWYFNTTGLKIADVEATVENQSADVVVEAPPA
ncbi:MAG TPA: lysylphosphatidylglycerol synthase domain-containing protein, partial [Planctomycetaceae bacterium]|nr:lysylphosphatidylglycerol synthase domain-containing protein [Planctomycetaceae bacterium]